MGTLVSNPTAVAAFDGQINKRGLDLTRSIISRDLGTEVVNPTATIRAGMLVSRDTSGYVVAATGLDTYGVAKWGKESLGYSVVVDYPVVLNGTTASNLPHGNVSNVTVRAAPNMAGAVYVANGTTGYTLAAVNGTVARGSSSTITDGATVYVTFTWAMTDTDFNFDGRFWQNQPADRTAYQDGRITVITSWARLFTTEWVTGDGAANDANSTYALTGANSKLYVSIDSKFTNDTTGSPDFVGRVYQLPTAQDPYMGITAGGNPTP